MTADPLLAAAQHLQERAERYPWLENGGSDVDVLGEWAALAEFFTATAQRHHGKRSPIYDYACECGWRSMDGNVCPDRRDAEKLAEAVRNG